MDNLNEIMRLRKKLGLTQKDLASRTSTSQSLIAKIESGKVDPSYTKVKVIFDTLHELEEEHSIKLRDVMTKGFISADRSMKISEVVKLMKSKGISQLPVFDGKISIGSVFEKTISDRIIAGGDLKSLSQMRVESVMGEAFPQIDGETSINIVSELLAKKYAILVTKNERIVGIVMTADVLKSI